MTPLEKYKILCELRAACGPVRDAPTLERYMLLEGAVERGAEVMRYGEKDGPHHFDNWVENVSETLTYIMERHDDT